MNRRGSILLLTLVFLVGLAGFTMAYITMVTYDTRNLGGQENNTIAFYLAEAGLNKAIWYLLNTAPDGSTDGSWRTSGYPAAPGAGATDPQQESLGSGTYTMWLTDSGSDVLITARGTSSGVVRTIRQIVEYELAGSTPEVFEYAVSSGGNFNMNNGDGSVITGDVNIAGNYNGSGATIVGTITTSNPLVMPTVDFAAYQADADHVIVGNKTFSSGSVSTGVWYVQGDVFIDQNATILGSVIATGNIIGNNAKDLIITAVTPNPALISGGDISFNNFKDSSITGLVYASNNININNGKDTALIGALIAGGDVSINNGKDMQITYDPNVVNTPYVSGGTTGGGGDPEINAVANSWGEI